MDTGIIVLRIISFVPRGSRESHAAMRQTSTFDFRLLFHQVTGLLRESGAGAAQMPRSQQYRACAEECRFEVETFRDPKARVQILELAAGMIAE